MRDWRSYVRERLAEAGEGGGMDEGVVRGLAEHLEDLYTGLRASGMTQQEALRRTPSHVGNWLELQQGITAARQEGAMNERVAKFWIPSLVTLVAAWGVLTILICAGVQPWMTHPAEPRGLIMYVPWLVVLPPVGAAGAYLARRANASGWRVYAAGAFPAVATALLFVLILPWALVVDRHVAPDFQLLGFATWIVSWVLLPGVALVIGAALEGLRGSHQKERLPRV